MWAGTHKVSSLGVVAAPPPHDASGTGIVRFAPTCAIPKPATETFLDMLVGYIELADAVVLPPDCPRYCSRTKVNGTTFLRTSLLMPWSFRQARTWRACCKAARR